MASKLAVTGARIGKINYVNTAPFYHNLFSAGVSGSLVEGTPAEINRAMRQGEIDFAPISSLEYALAQDQYLLFPDVCIGSRDFARSVLLLSREKIEGLNGETIVLSSKSVSAQALLQILLRFKYKFQNRFERSDGMPVELLAKGKAALVIGDEALFYVPKQFLYKYDLSELWWNWAHLPFCFAVWAVRRDFFKAHRDEAIDFHARLKRTLDANMQDLEKLLAEGLGMTLADERFPQVFGYLFNLNFYLDDEMRKGLERFYTYAAEAGLAPKVNQIEFVETS